MGYLEEMEQKLRTEYLEHGHVSNHADTADTWNKWQDSVVQFVRETVLASYRNGLKGARGVSSAPKSALAAGKLKPVQ